MTSGIICKLSRVPAAFELVFWLLFLKATGGGVLFTIYIRVYFEKQEFVFFLQHNFTFFFNYCLLQITNLSYLYILNLTNISPKKKKNMIMKAKYISDIDENYTGKKYDIN